MSETGLLFAEEFIVLFCFIVVVDDDNDVEAVEVDVVAVVVVLDEGDVSFLSPIVVFFVSGFGPVVSVTLELPFFVT